MQQQQKKKKKKKKVNNNISAANYLCVKSVNFTYNVLLIEVYSIDDHQTHARLRFNS